MSFASTVISNALAEIPDEPQIEVNSSESRIENWLERHPAAGIGLERQPI